MSDLKNIVSCEALSDYIGRNFKGAKFNIIDDVFEGATNLEIDVRFSADVLLKDQNALPKIKPALKKYRKVKQLAKGTFGEAILVKLAADSGMLYVIKTIKTEKKEQQEAAQSEADMLRHLNHPNIITFVESMVSKKCIGIVMEYAAAGDLSDLILQRKVDERHYTEVEALNIFLHICSALEYIHDANIIHRDIKPSNIFVTSENVFKLGDFGSATKLTIIHEPTEMVGTPFYLSPEMIKSEYYGFSTDVWSLGVTLYEILTLERPFEASSMCALMYVICNTEPSYTFLEREKPISRLTILLKSMLTKDPNRRPLVSEMVGNLKYHTSKLTATRASREIGIGSLSSEELIVLPADETSLLLFEQHAEMHPWVTLRKKTYRIKSRKNLLK